MMRKILTIFAAVLLTNSNALTDRSCYITTCDFFNKNDCSTPLTVDPSTKNDAINMYKLFSYLSADYSCVPFIKLGYAESECVNGILTPTYFGNDATCENEVELAQG